MSVDIFVQRVEIWLCQWVDIIDALCGILSLTSYCPGFGLRLRCVFAANRLRKQMAQLKLTRED